MQTNGDYIRSFDDDMLAILFDQIQIEAAEVALGYKDKPDNGCDSVAKWRYLLAQPHIKVGTCPFIGVLDI